MKERERKRLPPNAIILFVLEDSPGKGLFPVDGVDVVTCSTLHDGEEASSRSALDVPVTVVLLVEVPLDKGSDKR
jgi:hypothetical protein